jgi:hypothetical protein
MQAFEDGSEFEGLNIRDFDLNRLYFRVKYKRESNYRSEQDEDGNEVFVPYPEPGVTFLLGRNGAGKTTFLDGLKRFSRGEEDQRCQVSLILQGETKAGNAAWEAFVSAEDEVQRGRESPWFYEVVPPVVAMLTNRRMGETPRALDGRFAQYSGRDFLKFFEFDDSEIPAWVSDDVGSIHRVETDWQLEHRISRGPETLDVPLSPAWIFLDVVTQCILDVDNPAHISGRATTITFLEWAEDIDQRRAIRDAMRDFANEVLLELAVVEGEYKLRYLANLYSDGPLAKLVRTLEEDLETEPDRTTHSEESFRYAFPFDLVSKVFGPDGMSMVATPWVPAFPDQAHSIIFSSSWDPDNKNFERGFLRLEEPFPQKDADDVLHEAEEALFSLRLTPRVVEELPDSFSFEISGFEKLRHQIADLGQVLRNLECGIGALRLREYYWSPALGREYDSKDDQLSYLMKSIPIVGLRGVRVPFQVRIEWKRDDDEVWRNLTQASDGQKRLMATLLQLEHARFLPHVLMVADEFDSRLHPTTAEKLIQVIDAWMESASAVGFISTHNAGLAASSKNLNLYAVRGQNARFELTSYPVVSDLTAMAEVLGADQLSVISLRRLVVVVEGYHDLRVLEKLFDGERDILQYVWIIQAEGIRNFGLLWNVVLNHLRCPILFVHDKRSLILEAAVKALSEYKNSEDLWVESGLALVEEELKVRKKTARKENKMPPAGDDELMRMLDLMKRILSAGGQRRIHVHGLSAEDIVDYLEPSHFRRVSSWEEAHKLALAGGLDGQKFKDKHAINERFERALNSETLVWHQDIQELYDHIKRLAKL